MKGIGMNRFIVITATGILYMLFGVAAAQQNQSTQTKSGTQGSSGASDTASQPVAGRAPLGVTVVEMESVILGRSAKRDLLNKAVMNDQKEKIGTIDDLIITPSADGKLPSASYAIIGAGGFLGVGKHDVAIPMEQLKIDNNKQLILPGATKASLKALPRFEYSRK